MLPFILHHYLLGKNILSYADTESDLGVDITSNFTFNEHFTRIISQANEKYGLLRRTCHFVSDVRRIIVLYLTLVRSQFKHCSQQEDFKIFRKSKKCLKWILSEEELSYCSPENVDKLAFFYWGRDSHLLILSSSINCISPYSY